MMTVLVLYEYIVVQLIARQRCESNCWETVLVKVEQFEILLQMQGKFQKPRISNFECFKVYYGIVMLSVVYFVKLYSKGVAVQRCSI